MSGIKQLENFGTACAYGAYVLGGGVVVGMVRAAISVYHLAINGYFSEKKTQQTDKSFFGNLATKAEQFINNVTTMHPNTAWEDQGIRGAIELIPVIGAAYYTYHDWKNWNSIDKKPGVIGIKALSNAWNIQSNWV